MTHALASKSQHYTIMHSTLHPFTATVERRTCPRWGKGVYRTLSVSLHHGQAGDAQCARSCVAIVVPQRPRRRREGKEEVFLFLPAPPLPFAFPALSTCPAGDTVVPPFPALLLRVPARLLIRRCCCFCGTDAVRLLYAWPSRSLSSVGQGRAADRH